MQGPGIHSLETADPSAELAPYTAARLRDVLAPGFSPQPQFMTGTTPRVKVEKSGSGANVTAQ